MNENIKWISIAIIIVAAVAAGIAWGDDRPNAVTWSCRVGFSIAVLLATIPLFKLHFRDDLVHDYLREHTTTYFNRDGFCFNVALGSANGLAKLTVYFQSQQAERSIAHIALRPARGTFFTRAPFKPINCKIECSAAAFGVATLAIPIPEELQGKTQAFEVGAEVLYPNGKGERLRFRDGIPLHADSDFGNNLVTGLRLIGAAAGMLISSSPATVTFDLPTGVAAELSERRKPDVITRWRLGHPPLSSVV